MRLKVVIFSLLALSVSCPGLAAGIYDIDSAYEQEVMRAQVNEMNWLLGRNQPGGFDQPCGWVCRINVSGWMNTDAYITNTPPVFLVTNPLFNYPFDNLPPQAAPFRINTSGRASDLILNNANLFIDTRVNNWMKANMSLVYTSLSPVAGAQGNYEIPNSFLLYRPISRTNLDTAYATLQHFNVSPVYLRVGKEYVPFGQYDPYSFVTSENPTQLLSEINATTAQLGFTMPSGLYGSVYTFAGQPRLADGGSTRRIQNGGVNLGYTYSDCISSFNIDGGYIGSITDTNFLSSYYTNTNVEFAVNNVPGLPNQKAPAYNINAELQWGPLDFNGHYIATTRDFRKPFLLAFPVPTEFFFKKPKLWGFELGLTFPAIAKQTRLAIGYQATKHLPGILPNRRIYVDYLMNVSQWFDVGVAIFQNKDYSFGEGQLIGLNGAVLADGGSGNKSTVGQIRASVKFA
ncbi:LbtU family siderophore porin [Rickettsiella endosymbiont of Aleochara curtula]|uniref:LbtU family siderophore porin n=1 Tax=Rickettsiella endosymbiont of Aleochara curtula TaxID=3077936 RepID=UPI00313D251B